MNAEMLFAAALLPTALLLVAGAAYRARVLGRIRNLGADLTSREAEIAALEARLDTLRKVPPAEPGVPLPACMFTLQGTFLSANRTFMERFVTGPGTGVGPEGKAGTALEANRTVLRLRLLVARELDRLRDGRDGTPVPVARLTPSRGTGESGAYQVYLLADPVEETISAFLVPAVAGWTAPALSHAPVGVLFLDDEGRIAASNEAFRHYIGALAGEGRGENGADGIADPAGRFLGEYIGAGDRENMERFMARGACTEPVEVRLASREPEKGLEVSVSCRELRPGEGPDGARKVLYLIDIGHRRQLEAQVAQSQKMQAVGQLAGGVAHDFNNLLTAMNGYCDLLLARHRPGDQSFADLMQVKQNANRAAGLVRQLLAFSRQQTMIARVLDVTETLADLSHLLRRLIGENITLGISHGRDLAPVRVDQGQLEQVVINLVVNARDACPDGGAITMETLDVVVDAPVQQGDGMMPAGRYVRLDVSDTGTGIDGEIIARIFEPFFSTKEVGEGTGLGLSTVYGIVKQINGFISVASTVGAGTTFSVFLPAYEGAEPVVRAGYAAADSPADRPADRKDLTGGETIMLVEDEDPVRLFGARALRNKGYRVIEARNGEAALQLLADRSEEIDLLVTDVVMPGMDGPTLVRKAREGRPELRVICISGYSEDALRQRIEEDTNIHFLPKPFSLRQLAGTVKNVLHPLS